MNNTLAIMSICIGRYYCDDKLFNYFKNVIIPDHIENVTLYITLADHGYESHLNMLIRKYKLNIKFDKIIIIPGREGLVSRNKSLQKHRATGVNLNIGLSRVVEKYIHIVDDDVIPPDDSLIYMFDTLLKNSDAGAVSGLYFIKKWNNMENSLWRNDKVYARMVNICTETAPDTIDILAQKKPTKIKYSGNGCLLAITSILKFSLPVETRKLSGNIALGPDYHLCDSVRENNKQLYIQPHVMCEHYSGDGHAGMGKKHFDTVVFGDRNINNRITILEHSDNINYTELLTDDGVIYSIGYNGPVISNIIPIDLESIKHRKKVLEEHYTVDAMERIDHTINDEIVYSVLNSNCNYSISSRLTHTNPFYAINGDNIITPGRLIDYFKPVNITKIY